MSEVWLETFIHGEAKRLKEIINKNGPISLLPPTKRGEAAEHMVEFRLLEEGIYCWPVKAHDARDRIIFDPFRPEKSSSIQIKYINYATAGSHGAYLQFSESLIESRERPDYIFLCEDPIGEYRYFVLMNAEIRSELQEKGKQRSSDPKRVPRIRLYIPRNLSPLADYEDRFRDFEAHPRHDDPM